MWFQINQLRSYQRILVYDKSFSLDALKLFSSSLSFIRLPKKCLSGDFLEVILIFVFWAAHMFRLNIYSKLGNISFIISLFFSDDLPLFFCFFFLYSYGGMLDVIPHVYKTLFVFLNFLSFMVLSLDYLHQPMFKFDRAGRKSITI